MTGGWQRGDLKWGKQQMLCHLFLARKHWKYYLIYLEPQFLHLDSGSINSPTMGMYNSWQVGHTAWCPQLCLLNMGLQAAPIPLMAFSSSPGILHKLRLLI